MVVQAKVRVAVSDCRVIEAKDLLLDDDSLGLQLDGLDAVAVLVLDVGHLGQAGSNFLCHSACYLHQGVCCLVVQVKGLVKLALVGGDLTLLDGLRGVLRVVVDQLHYRRELSNHRSLERQHALLEELLVGQGNLLLFG